MADITKCTNDYCPLFDCKRKTTPSNPFYQSLSKFDYKVVCEYYLIPL